MRLPFVFLLMALPLLHADGPGPLKSKWDNARQNQAFIDAMPPLRVSFEAKAPFPVVVAKVVDDIGEYFPFTPAHVRANWEAAGYRAINTASSGNRAPGLVADLVGTLDDPATMVLPASEGQGRHVLPVLFRVSTGPRGVHRVLVAGGDAHIKPFSGKRIVSIDRQSLDQYLAERLGAKPTEARIASCLVMAMTRSSAFKVLLGFEGGESTQIDSTDAHPKAPWVLGGWKGTPLHEIDSLKKDGLAGITQIDARLLAWAPLLAGDLPKNLVAIGRGAKKHQLYKGYRAHRGYSEALDRNPYTNTYRMDAVGDPLQMANLRGVGVFPPQYQIVNSVASNLIGWGFGGTLNWPADQVSVNLGNGWRVLMRTATFFQQVPPQSVIVSGTYRLGSTLSKRAAVALAAARVINYDHAFGHTPEHLQEAFFKGIVREYESAADVGSFLRRLGPYSKDTHLGLWDRLGVNFTTEFPPAAIFSSRPPGPRLFLPFELAVTDEKVRVIWTYQAAEVVPVGAEILEIDGLKVKDLIARVRAENPSPNTCPIRAGVRLNDLLPNTRSHGFVYKDQDGSVRRVTVAEGGEEPSAMAPPTELPSGWTLLNKSDQISNSELVDRLAKGENFILDTRFEGLSIIKRSQPTLSNHTMPMYAMYVEADKPFNWGEASRRSYHMEHNSRKTERPSASLKGTLVMIVCGLDQSYMESWKSMLRMQLGDSLYTIGFPSSGITGAISVLDFPDGDGAGRHIYTPTGAWANFGADTMQYRGLLLDEALDLEAVFRSGTRDPLLATVIRRIGEAGK